MSGFRARLLILAGSLATSLVPVAAGAKILTVMGIGEPASLGSSNCDGTWHCSTLRDAMNNTTTGDTIRFSAAIDGQPIVLEFCSNPASGTEFGPSAFFITGNKAILIDGMSGLSRGITITRDSFAPGCAASGASPAFRLFDVDAGSSLSLYGLTLQNGLAQGGSSKYGGGALGAGGAIFSRGEVVILQCTFIGNVAQGGSSGNGLLGYGGAGVGADATGSGGGGPNGGNAVGSNPGGFGGGGSAYDAGGAGGFGGGGGAGGAGGAGGFGGGGGANSGISSGSGGFGGGAGGATNPSSGGGAGAGMGGAVFNDAGTLTVTNSTFTGNSALGGNTSADAGNGSGFGGAIFNYSGTMNVTYATLVRNSVAAGTSGSGGSADGGAIYSLNDGNCASGGNSCSAPSPATGPIVQSSILADSIGSAHDLVVTSINAANTDARGGTLNLIMSYDANQFEAFRVMTTAEPRLSPLGYFGGWNATMAPNAGSPVVDLIACYAGPLPANDQRGVTRPQGSNCDVGAVEYDNDNIFGAGFD